MWLREIYIRYLSACFRQIICYLCQERNMILQKQRQENDVEKKKGYFTSRIVGIIETNLTIPLKRCMPVIYVKGI